MRKSDVWGKCKARTVSILALVGDEPWTGKHKTEDGLYGRRTEQAEAGSRIGFCMMQCDFWEVLYKRRMLTQGDSYAVQIAVGLCQDLEKPIVGRRPAPDYCQFQDPEKPFVRNRPAPCIIDK